MCLQDIDSFLYFFLLLYADDTVVLAECPEDLQRALDILKIYCDSGVSILMLGKPKS